MLSALSVAATVAAVSLPLWWPTVAAVAVALLFGCYALAGSLRWRDQDASAQGRRRAALVAALVAVAAAAGWLLVVLVLLAFEIFSLGLE